MTTETNTIRIRNQCPLCCSAHYNGRARLCDSCGRKAFALDLLGALLCFACVALIGAALLSL